MPEPTKITCNFCDKVGHIDKVCLAKPKVKASANPINIDTISQATVPTANSKLELKRAATVERSLFCHDPCLVNVALNGHNIRMLQTVENRCTFCIEVAKN